MPNADLRLNQITEKDTGKVFQLENATPTFDSVAAMKSATWLTMGQSARTLGYYAPGDGGGNDYEIVAAGTGTDDGGSFIDLAESGLQAKGLFSDGRITARRFGVSATGDSSGKLKAMWTYAAGRSTRIDVSCVSSTKIDLLNIDVDCEVDEDSVIDCSAIADGLSLNDQYFLQAQGSVAAISNVTENVQPYSANRADVDPESTIIVADGTKFAPGDTVILRSDQLFDDLWTGNTINKRGEMLKVKSVSANVVTVADRVRFSYLAASNAVLEKLDTIRFRWHGGKAVGGGVGSAHSFLLINIAEDVDINSQCDHFEDNGFFISRTYKSRLDVRPNYCTSPSALGNTGYGVASLNGSRYADINAVGIRCRHIVTGGGVLPSLETRVTGEAIDCGIGSEAWDCHEPCFEWEFDVAARGGNGGAVIRGSDIKIRLDTRDCLKGLKIRTFDGLTAQKNIHFDVKASSVKGSAVTIDAASSPIRNLTFGTVDIENVRLDGMNVLGDVDGVHGSVLRVKETWLRDGEIASSGRGFYANGEAHSAGVRARNIQIASVYIRDTLKEGAKLEFCKHVTFDESNIEAENRPAVQIDDSKDVHMPKGRMKFFGPGSPFFTNRSDTISTGCRLLADIGNTSADGWRGVDTINASMINCPQVNAGRHGAYFSGTSNNLIAVGNNFVGVVNANKVNIDSATNVVEANNLV